MKRFLRPFFLVTFFSLICAFRPCQASTVDDLNDSRLQDAAKSFAQGLLLLRQGAPLSEVKKQWETTGTEFPTSAYRDQLQDYLGVLEYQVKDETKSSANTGVDPAKLPISSQVDFYVSRLTEVRGTRQKEDDYCHVLGQGQDTTASDQLVRLGRAAVPVLIEYLDDRRLTRSVIVTSRKPPAFYVLRGQDVAVECIQKILHLPVYNHTEPGVYLSNAQPYLRQRTIDAIKSWWGTYGNKPAVEGLLVQLDVVDLPQRFEMLREIEKIAPGKVNAVEFLLRWATYMDAKSRVQIAEELARRGNFSIRPIFRKELGNYSYLPEEAQGYVSYMMRYGEAQDCRLIAEALRGVIGEDKQPYRFENLFTLTAKAAQDTRNPLAVPILVEMLMGLRDVQFKYAAGDARVESVRLTSVNSLTALADITKHRVEYEIHSSPINLFAAIEEWLEWWQRIGKSAFLRKYPSAKEAWPGDRPSDPRKTQTLLQTLPAVVKVADARFPYSLNYSVPREEMLALLRTGEIEVVESPEENSSDAAFRFTSHKRAMQWLATTHPAKPDAHVTSPLIDVAEAANQGPVFTAGGRTWFFRPYPQTAVEISGLKRQVEEASAQPSTRVAFITGAEPILCDSTGRIWMHPTFDFHLLLGYDPASHRWIERHCVTGLEKSVNSVRNILNGAAWENKNGQLFFADRLGVHVLVGETWSYQPFYERNLRGEPDYNESRAFNSIRFAEDDLGQLYAWSWWTQEGDMGTYGFWMFDGKAWKNIDAIEQIGNLIPQRLEAQDKAGVWLVNGLEISYLCDGVLTKGKDALRYLGLAAETRDLRVQFQSEAGTYAWVQLGVPLDPTDKSKIGQWVFAPVFIPKLGSAISLSDESKNFYKESRQVLRDAAGRVWAVGSNDDGDFIGCYDGENGRLIFNLPLHHLQQVAIRCVEGNNLYINGSGRIWCLNIKRYRDVERSQPKIGTMRVRIQRAWIADSQNHLWCTWGSDISRAVLFDGKSWKDPAPARSTLPAAWGGFLCAFPGKGHAMVLVDQQFAWSLFDGKTVVTEKSAADLAKKYLGRLQQILPTPSVPSVNFYCNLARDRRGNIWWSNWSHDWGVVGRRANGEIFALDGKTLDASTGPGRNESFVVFQPMGESSLLAADDAGGKVLYELNDGKLTVKPAGFISESRLEWNTPSFAVDGGVWVASRSDRKSKFIALDSKKGLQVLQTQQGIVLGVDTSRGVWFYESRWNNKNAEHFLVRLAPEGKTAELATPQLRETLAFAPDGSVWALTDSGASRIAYRNGKLKLLENRVMPVNDSTSLWCDNQGRLWRIHSLNQEREMVCYAGKDSMEAVGEN